jgi:hypothetical protein
LMRPSSRYFNDSAVLYLFVLHSFHIFGKQLKLIPD